MRRIWHWLKNSGNTGAPSKPQVRYEDVGSDEDDHDLQSRDDMLAPFLAETRCEIIDLAAYRSAKA